jgi:Bacterial Ig domain/CHRD domain
MICASLAAVLTACGGGYGSSSTGAAPGATCGGTYAVACPPPTVSLTAPAADATVSGTVALTATASASSTYNLTVSSVEFEVDGTSVGTAMSSPYTFNWDSTKVANGNHSITAIATDSASDMTTSSPVTVNVQNAAAAAAALGPEQLFPMPSSRASGVARLSTERESGALSGSVTLSGLSAKSVTINEGFAGTSGDAVLALAPHSGQAGVWDVPAGAQLTPQQAAALEQGRLYVIATSAAYPNGEVRGQLAPPSIRVTFTALSSTPEADAALGSGISAVAATTLDTGAGTLTVHVSSRGVEDTTGAAVTSGAAKLAELTRDTIEPGHWSTELAPVSAADIESFKAGRWAVSVAASAAPQGALRGQIEPAEPAAHTE